MKKAAFIGTGSMGSALARAACRALEPDQVVVTNRTFSKAETLAKELGCAVSRTNREAAQAAEYLFLCVKPQQIQTVITEIQSELQAGKKLVSVAAGVKIRNLEDWAQQEVPVFRIMPNTPCAIGKGMTALAGGSYVQEKHWHEVESILSASGQVDRVGESLFDAFSAVAGCGPAFFYLYLEALADGGVAAGLSRQAALHYAAQTAVGAAGMVLETGKHPGKLKDEVCSPGGSTIAGVAALERHGVRAAAIDAVLAAWEKGKQMGEQN